MKWEIRVLPVLPVLPVLLVLPVLPVLPSSLHEKHGGEAGEEGDGAVDELGPDETLFAFGKERDGGVTVLGDAAGKQHGEWNDSCCEQCHEDQMRTGLRDDTDKGSEQDH